MRRWHDLLYDAARRWIDFKLRRRSPPAILLTVGLVLVTASLSIGGLAGSLSWDSPFGLIAVIVESEGGGLSIDWSAVAFLAGLVLLAVGGCLLARDHVRDRRKIVVIEHRGLHRGVDTPLAEHLPSGLTGRVDSVLIDHRQLTSTAEIRAPEDALRQLHNLRGSVKERRDAAGPGNAVMVYGGMAPVPFTFLVGMLLGDENNITVMDWDRTEERWRELDGADDSERFALEGLENFDTVRDSERPREAALAVAASYPSDVEAIRRTVGNLPLVRLALPTLGVDRHWSRDKQAALCLQFTNVLARLIEWEVRRIHLFIAAPNSLVFNLGRRYDDRLHPNACIYQYERSATPPFPWAVELPTHGRQEATLLRPQAAAA